MSLWEAWDERAKAWITWARTPYLDERRSEDHIGRDGLAMTVSMHRPLSAYVSAIRSAGFAIDALREFGAKPVPWLMVMRLTRLATRQGSG